MRKHSVLLAVAGGLAVSGLPAQAAGVFWAVDDATVLDPRNCHVESWIERPRGGPTGLTVAPACADSRGIEWAVAGHVALSGGSGDPVALLGRLAELAVSHRPFFVRKIHSSVDS
jgi:hypothetical protein